MTPKSREYGSPIEVKRWHRQELATMPWPSPCAVCGIATRAELDGRRLCAAHLRKAA